MAIDEQAYSETRWLAEQGDSDACCAMGLAYKQAKDYELAVYWLEKAKAYGSLNAQRLLNAVLSEIGRKRQI